MVEGPLNQDSHNPHPVSNEITLADVMKDVAVMVSSFYKSLFGL